MKSTTDSWGLLIYDALIALLFGLVLVFSGAPVWAGAMTSLISFQIRVHTRH